jgi:hypothetical protein
MTGVSAAREVTGASSGIAGSAANKDPARRAELKALPGLPFTFIYDSHFASATRAVCVLEGVGARPADDGLR